MARHRLPPRNSKGQFRKPKRNPQFYTTGEGKVVPMRKFYPEHGKSWGGMYSPVKAGELPKAYRIRHPRRGKK